jgi:hypothetical protein
MIQKVDDSSEPETSSVKKTRSKKTEAPARSAADLSFEMRYAQISISGISALSWSKEIPPPPKKGDKRDHEEKYWRQRVHSVDGTMVIPSMSLRHSMVKAMRGVKIPGEGNATYAPIFETAITPMEGFGVTDVKIDDLQPEWFFVPGNPSKGKPGTGARVHKCFPMIQPGWKASFTFVLYDDRLVEDILSAAVKYAGVRVGLGRFRPENGGFYGRFQVDEVKISNEPV